jgi:hypothetical protein
MHPVLITLRELLISDCPTDPPNPECLSSTETQRKYLLREFSEKEAEGGVGRDSVFTPAFGETFQSAPKHALIIIRDREQTRDVVKRSVRTLNQLLQRQFERLSV